MSSNQLLEDELTGFCRSHALSEDGLRAIFEGHGVAPNNNDPNISYEFFHEACLNKKVTEGILRYLLEYSYFPHAVRYADGYISDETEEKVGGCTPLHSICFNKNVTLGMVQLIIDAYPDSIRHENNYGCMPLHQLCRSKGLNDEVGLKILKLLLERCPESVRHATSLPIHYAAARQSPEFCRILIQAYPGSERMTTDNLVVLPLHMACTYNTVATAEYLYKLYPESINVATNVEFYPIHLAINGIKFREDNSETAVEMIQFLLHYNPNVALQECNGKLPFILLHHWMNENEDEINDNRSRLNACLKILQLLYDAHPDVIEDNEVISNVGQSHVEVQIFINTQLTYARHAKDRIS